MTPGPVQSVHIVARDEEGNSPMNLDSTMSTRPMPTEVSACYTQGQVETNRCPDRCHSAS